MSAFFPQLAKAVAFGAAMETGRDAVRRNGQGLGFAAGDNFAAGDRFWENDYFDIWYPDFYYNGGGGGADWPSFDWIDWSGGFAEPSISPSGNEARYDFDWNQYWNDWFSGNLETINTTAPSPLPRGFDPFALPGLEPYRDIWPWSDRGPSPAPFDPSGNPQLPGYCPRGTYHPVNDPMACVPFPPSDPNAKKQQQQQQKAQQQAAQALRRAQQQADKQCPKDPQGRPVWRNPQTGKCELVPTCPQGTKFDSATRRCLTAAQAKELYGDNNWLLWLLIALGVVVIANSGSDGGGRRR